MALSRKPTRSSVLTEQEIDKLINKGGGLPEKPLAQVDAPALSRALAKVAPEAPKTAQQRGRKKKPFEEPKIPTQLRLSQEMLDEIDQIIGQRKIKVSRHSWFLEAIFEKIEREK